MWQKYADKQMCMLDVCMCPYVLLIPPIILAAQPRPILCTVDRWRMQLSRSLSKCNKLVSSALHQCVMPPILTPIASLMFVLSTCCVHFTIISSLALSCDGLPFSFINLCIASLTWSTNIPVLWLSMQVCVGEYEKAQVEKWVSKWHMQIILDKNRCIFSYSANQCY